MLCVLFHAIDFSYCAYFGFYDRLSRLSISLNRTPSQFKASVLIESFDVSVCPNGDSSDRALVPHLLNLEHGSPGSFKSACAPGIARSPCKIAMA